ncbi:phosphopantetheine-binding protein [Nonomuraea sp. NPDC046802]|uniref:phosphopantetheine-binding protein n=1 Tax=Nonomuraea sp. NPDC046802 TaxID=3154919 RepID=UPI0033C03AF5
MPWDHQFELLMRKALRLLEPQNPLPPDVSTARMGLDSLTTVELLLGVEETYGILIPDDMVGPRLFTTPQVLWDAICELRADSEGSEQ